MSRISRRSKAVLAAVLIASATATVSSASTQHHPFSELFPPDVNLDFGGKDIKNVSTLETATIIPNSSDITFKDSGNVEILRYNDSGADWELQNSDIDTNGNNITSTGGEMCIGKYC